MDFPGPGDVHSFWDLSHQPATFSALPDDDFLAFLQKQFPAAPPSSDSSSPSPPSVQNDSTPSRRQSGVFNSSASPTAADSEDPSLKRKASHDSMDEEPSHKNAHITSSNNPSANKKSGGSRRKSGGQQDESRLLKRKEQNRAAQRAFRERKEKHVKDLEDKVAALEAKNQMTESENENLRDLLSRLQNENMMLKQAAFTFSMPRETTSNNGRAPYDTQAATNFNFVTPGAGPSKPIAAQNSVQPPFDLNSLISFDPNMLNVAEEQPDSAMNVEYGFGQPNQYTTIASNPMFTSFAEPSPSDSPPLQINGNGNHFNQFDFSNLEQWTPTELQNNGERHRRLQRVAHEPSKLIKSRLACFPPLTLVLLSSQASTTPTSTSSPSTGASPANAHSDCPKTKEQLSKAIADGGQSSFVQQPSGPIVMCKGSSFPKTEKSDKNVEVLAAWRSITSNPQFKQDVDINELCSEFTAKAKCDGTKVVLEPAGVHHIIETLAAKRHQQQAQK
ncbi:hypothetical protein A0H81_00164 [Grifola frondosa]|uniref:BZIP domain-containing protein n=1 Tax=Grifola frondosa TaxID=5627 RepID=A0A1C7MUD0_GRIFR|nr:hypothetical protein A0H81_00164 [Grifola frondosa]